FDRIDRGGILPRPKRVIPIWIGGFSEPAFQRGARLGDGYIFALGFAKACEALDRVRHHLAQSGRPAAGFGTELIAQTSQPAAQVEHIEKWRDLGGTHAAIDTMRKGLTTVDAHIDFIAEFRNRWRG